MRKNGKFMNGQPDMNRACAYCHSGQHQGYMSVKMVKRKKCTAKQCPYLEKYEDHPYWVRKAEIKALQRAAKSGENACVKALA